MFGFHKWAGCKCSVCSKTRDQDHDWSKDCGKCLSCSKTRDPNHDWSSDCEKCNRCGFMRPLAHQWQDGKCKKCGKRGIMTNNLPEFSKNNFPLTFEKYAYANEQQRVAWFATIFELISLCERQMREDALPFLPLTLEQLDTLSLSKDELVKTVSDPQQFEQLFSGIFGVGIGRLKARGTSQERNGWVDTMERCYKPLFLLSVGGSAIVKIMYENRNQS